MKVGYARTSIIDQNAGFEAQIKELESIGCEKIFSESWLVVRTFLFLYLLRYFMPLSPHKWLITMF
jgi:hypothetical protein